MYKAGEIEFSSYLKAVKFANENKLEVFEVRADGSSIRRWFPAPAVTSKKVRMYNERKAAHEAQQRMNEK